MLQQPLVKQHHLFRLKAKKAMKFNLHDKSEFCRTKILNKLSSAQNINNGLVSDRGQSVRVFPQPTDLLATFCDELETLKGNVLIGNDKEELKAALKKLSIERGWNQLYCRDTMLRELLDSNFCISTHEDEFVNMEVGITRCEFLVARTGSVVVSSAHQSGRLMNVFPPVHIIIANASQLVPFLEEAIQGMKDRYVNQMPSQITVITGASRTADIEKTLVMGAHGPKELFVLIDRNN